MSKRVLHLAVVLFMLGLAVPLVAGAAVSVKVVDTHTFDEYDGLPGYEGVPDFGVRIVGTEAADEVVLTMQDGHLLVNGQDPRPEPLSLSEVIEITIRGGGGDDLIDLSGMEGFSHTLWHYAGLSMVEAAGDAGNDRMLALNGDARDIEFIGRQGASLLRGGPGEDLIMGFGGRDALNGGPGDDRLFGRGGADGISGSAGSDRIWGGANLADGRNRDVLTGGSGSDWLFGGPGEDLLMGKKGLDVLNGGPGRDTMYQNTRSRRWPGGCQAAPPGLCNPIIG